VNEHTKAAQRTNIITLLIRNEEYDHHNLETTITAPNGDGIIGKLWNYNGSFVFPGTGRGM
jgi:hypothetical protein